MRVCIIFRELPCQLGLEMAEKIKVDSTKQPLQSLHVNVLIPREYGFAAA